MKAVDALTINEEYRLKKKIIEYEDKLKDAPKISELESHLAAKIIEQDALKNQVAGILVTGLPRLLVQQYGLNQIESIKPLFVLYSIIGLGVLGIYFLISNRVELNRNNNNNSSRNNDTTSIPRPFKPSLLL